MVREDALKPDGFYINWLYVGGQGLLSNVPVFVLLLKMQNLFEKLSFPGMSHALPSSRAHNPPSPAQHGDRRSMLPELPMQLALGDEGVVLGALEGH